jgi:hypothetical protein
MFFGEGLRRRFREFLMPSIISWCSWREPEAGSGLPVLLLSLS